MLQSKNTWRSAITAVFFFLSCIQIAHSQGPVTLSDRESDPKSLGLMQGFPPSKEKRVTLPDSNFFSFPKLRWSVCHMRELLPTATIKRNPEQYTQLTA